MADYTFDIDYSDDIARLEKHPGYTTLPPRLEIAYFTLHYSGVVSTDRSHDAELARILSEARYQLHHDYSGNGSSAYPDGLLYDCVILSDGTCVRTRARSQQLWHCGNVEGNAKSFAGHVMLGPGQDATPVQWQRVLRVIDEVRDAHTFPVRHIVGHCEWPRRNGEPRPSAVYTVLPEQSECPGRILHARLAQARAAASITPIAAYTADSPILSPPGATKEQALAWLDIRCRDERGRWSCAYTRSDVAFIVDEYWRQAPPLGLDPVKALSQSTRETSEHYPDPDNDRDPYRPFSSRKAQRPQRNPAGIGASNDGAAGVSFPTWKDDAIPAHLGRLLAYALPVGAGTPAQQAAITKALMYRELPDYMRGSAQTLKQLGRAHNLSGRAGWADPGTEYGARIAEVANAIARMPP